MPPPIATPRARALGFGMKRARQALTTYIDYERTATTMADWSPGLVPGMLQTPAYTRAIFARTTHPESHIEHAVRVRFARRERLVGRSPLQCQVLLNEAVLRQYPRRQHSALPPERGKPCWPL